MAGEAEALKYLTNLDAKLKARGPEIALYEAYYEGQHRLQFATSRFRQTFGSLFSAFADNWCSLVVDASVERLIINGFRSETGDSEIDKAASRIWQDNYLDSDYRMAHTEACKLGNAYLLVDGENKAFDTESPLITVEHPSQAIVLHDPTNPRHRLAGLKEWMDEDGRVCATLYTPDTIYRFEASSEGYEEPAGLSLSGLTYPSDYVNTPSGAGVRWIPRKGVPFEVPNTLGAVPLIPLRNNPTLKVGGRSDLSSVIPLNDACNKLISDMLIASEFAAYPQRWATGLEVPKDPETGRPLTTQQFLASVGRVWVGEHPDVKFGQFAASDLKPYIAGVEMLIQHVAAITRTPPHYLLGQSGNFPSGDSLTATETGLVAKVRGKQSTYQTTWSEVLKLAFKANNDEHYRQSLQTVWANPEQRIFSQKVDGAMKMSVLGVPQDALWETCDATPEQIERWHAMKRKMAEAEPGSLEAAEYSTQFAIPPTAEEAEAEKPTSAGPEGNLVEEQSITQAERISRIHD